MIANSGQPIRVLNIITRMILGGAQETAMLSSALLDREHVASEILTGLETGSEGELHSECRRRGIPLHFEPTLVRRVDPVRDLIAIFRIARFIRRGRYDVVHTHSSKAGIVGRIAAWMAGTPVVVHTVHGWGFNPGQGRLTWGLYVFLETWCANFCRTLVVVGNADREVGLGLAIGRPSQYRLIRSGIEVERYRDVELSSSAARERFGLPADAFVVGSVARLSPQKAPLDMLEAFGHLARACPLAHLVMVGDGPLRADVARAIEHEGLGGRVHLLGLRTDVPEILRAFDVFALSSHWEGLPRVFPQAMAAGLPIVATRVAGAADAIVHGENGYLVDMGDTSGMGKRLVELASNRDLGRRMGERGRERVGEFSAQLMVNDLDRLYGELVGRVSSEVQAEADGVQALPDAALHPAPVSHVSAA
jgi:glycosyltransferase involved in cell wall biosynthesis